MLFKEEQVMKAILNTFDDVVSKAWMQAVKAYRAILRAVKHYNQSKSHAYYVKLKTCSKRSRRTRYEKLRYIMAEIPTPSLGREEYLILMFYMTRQRILHRQNFNRRIEYILRELKKLAEKLEGSELHVFIYFMGYQFRIGVYERAKEIRRNIVKQGYNILLRLVELRYDNSLYDLVFRDVFQFLSSRAYKLIERPGFRKTNGMVFSKPKHFLDWILLVLTYLREDNQLRNIVEDLLTKTEAPISKYKDLLLSMEHGSLVVNTGLRPKLLAARETTYGVGVEEAVNDNSQDEEDEDFERIEKDFEVVEDRYERYDPYEVIR